MLPGAKHAQNHSKNRQQATKKAAGAKTVKTKEALREKRPGVSTLPDTKYKQTHSKDSRQKKTHLAKVKASKTQEVLAKKSVLSRLLEDGQQKKKDEFARKHYR
jgi:hypothetical protein